MKMEKRQIVLGALILALGAAVYLNWQFSDIVSTQTIEVVSDEDEITTEELGIAQLVNNSYLEVVTDEIITDGLEVSVSSTDLLSETRISRQETRDEALEILSDIIDDENVDSETKQTAVESSAEIAQNMISETSAESLIKAKGIDDVVVFINDGECNVIVSELGNNALIIQEVINSQMGFDLDKIHIIEVVD